MTLKELRERSLTGKPFHFLLRDRIQGVDTAVCSKQINFMDGDPSLGNLSVNAREIGEEIELEGCPWCASEILKGYNNFQNRPADPELPASKSAFSAIVSLVVERSRLLAELEAMKKKTGS